jgi:hypothetical protein
MTVRFPRLLSLATTLLLGGCALFTGPDEPTRLEEARALWDQVGPRDYTFEFTPDCFCALGGQRIRVTVDDGAVTTARMISTDAPVEAYLFATIPTVPELFDLIQQALDRNAYRIEASYDGTYGYPVRVAIDYERNTIDEEYGFTITGFASLEILGTGR